MNDGPHSVGNGGAIDIDALADRVVDEAAALGRDPNKTPHERVAGMLREAWPKGVDAAAAEVAALPRDGLAFVLLRFPDGDDALDHSHALKTIADRMREANPNAYLLVLPEGWSFRNMPPEMARAFARNVLAFVSEDELLRIGLHRAADTLVSAGAMTPEETEALKKRWQELVDRGPPMRIEAPVPDKATALAWMRDVLPVTTCDELAALGLMRDGSTEVNRG